MLHFQRALDMNEIHRPNHRVGRMLPRLGWAELAPLQGYGLQPTENSFQLKNLNTHII